MRLNPAISAKANILALINAANPLHTFTEENVTIGVPSVASSGAPAGELFSLTDNDMGAMVNSSSEFRFRLNNGATPYFDMMFASITFKFDRATGAITVSFSAPSEEDWLSAVAKFKAISQIKVTVGGMEYTLPLAWGTETTQHPPASPNGSFVFPENPSISQAMPPQSAGNSNIAFVFNGGASAGGNNTALVITAIANKGFSGTKQIKYRRLTITEAAGPKVDDLVEVLPEDTEEQVRDKVIAALGLVGEGSGLSSAVVQAPTPESPGSFSLEGVEESLLYLAGATSLTIIFPQIALEEAIAQGDLQGFEPAAEAIALVLWKTLAGVEPLVFVEDGITQYRWTDHGIAGVTDIDMRLSDDSDELTDENWYATFSVAGMDGDVVRALADAIQGYDYGNHQVRNPGEVRFVDNGAGANVSRYIASVAFDLVPGPLAIAEGSTLDIKIYSTYGQDEVEPGEEFPSLFQSGSSVLAGDPDWLQVRFEDIQLDGATAIYIAIEEEEVGTLTGIVDLRGPIQSEIVNFGERIRELQFGTHTFKGPITLEHYGPGGSGDYSTIVNFQALSTNIGYSAGDSVSIDVRGLLPEA